jgi:hypothetical protein
MKKLKLKLDLESILVESFGVEPILRARSGTVAAHDITNEISCYGNTCGLSCPGQNTNCICVPDTYPETWDNNCYQTGQYSCQELTGGCECASANATMCHECTY